MKITINNCGETLCHYYECMFCAGGKCHGGLYQCPHIAEHAKACLVDATNEYEEGVAKNYGSEYLQELKSHMNKYKRILEDECY